MNEDTMNQKTEVHDFDSDDMLEEYDFSHAKPGRYRAFKGKLIRVLDNGIEQLIELKKKDEAPKNQD